MKKGFRLFLVLTILLFLLDQFVKIWARSAAHNSETTSFLPLWPGVFELKLVYNEGVAFGMFQGAGILLTPVAVGIAVVATWYSWKHPSNKPLVHVTAALLASGALGNLIDRLAHGKVTDMFWIRAINFPVFNIADVCITAAGILLIFGALGDLTGHKPPAQATDATAVPSDPSLEP